MYKKLLLFILLVFAWTSCVLPRIVYSIENIQPSEQDDLIALELVKGETLTTGGERLYVFLDLKILNNRDSTISIGHSLEIAVDSTILKAKIISGSIPHFLEKNKSDVLKLEFMVEDPKSIVYKAREKKKAHKLLLSLYIQDVEGVRSKKTITLKPVGLK